MEERRTTPPSLSACLDRIRAWARANGWKPARLAREADVAEKVTRRMNEPDWVPNASSIAKLEAVIPTEWIEGDVVESRSVSRSDQPAA